MRLRSLLVLLLAVVGCSKTKAPPPTPPAESTSEAAAGSAAGSLTAVENAHPAKLQVTPPQQHPTATTPKVQPLAVCHAEGLDPLSAARQDYDEGKYEPALSCASQAAALHPDDPQAHSERAAALTALGQLEDAQLAYARALALDPDHLDALLGAAHLYIASLSSTREHDELGSVYAEHGLSLAQDQNDAKLVAEFALLSAMAFNDLGQSKDALDRAEKVLEIDKKSAEARYERAVALFELDRFADAKAAFLPMLQDEDRAAHANYHLGLLLEREGKLKEAEEHLAKAHELSPDDFPEPVMLSQQEFAAEVKKAVSELPTDMQRDLKGIPVTPEEIPKDADLLSGDPPLSPAILGLFRGPSLGEACQPEDGDPCRSVVLYRKNLGRAVKSREELLEQIRVTLLHEVGHLRGEDDFELAARGLE